MALADSRDGPTRNLDYHAAIIPLPRNCFCFATNKQLNMQIRILKEPTFYFLVLAAGISFFYWLFNNQNTQPIQIDWQEVEARILVTELTQGYPATEQQRREIEESLINDYILVVEAYELGLQNDARINDILAQKMRHVLSGNVIQPTDQELESFYQEYLPRYQQPARLTATELVFSTQEPLPELLLEQLASGISEQELTTDLNRIAGILPRVTQDDLNSIFDSQIARQAFAASDATWVGPYQSNRGQHWLQVDERFPARTPTLEEIVEQVRLDWITLEEEVRLEQEIDVLRNRYEIAIINRP